MRILARIESKIWYLLIGTTETGFDENFLKKKKKDKKAKFIKLKGYDRESCRMEKQHYLALPVGRTDKL